VFDLIKRKSANSPINPTRRHSVPRRGAASVELAVVAIPLFLFVGASIEFGRAMMTTQALEEAARSACRVAVLKGATTKNVDREIGKCLAITGISEYTTELEPLALETMPQWAPVTVRITAEFDDMTWLPVPQFLSGRTYTASCVLPREAEPKKPDN
jgi:TadE-like protein